MEPAGIITLLTDFGTADGYVAAMKGVILNQSPRAQIIDAAHDIPPQDVLAGAWALRQYANYYPPGTIHVAVVDPGVGTARRALLLEADGRCYLAPDNGILGWIARDAKVLRKRALLRDVRLPGETSATFHGRDIFSFAAGVLASRARDVDGLSTEIDDIIWPPWVATVRDGTGIAGHIVHIDVFGNLVTNIERATYDQAGWPSARVRLGRVQLERLQRTYADVEPGQLVALWGSTGHLEVALRNGSAAKVLGIQRGAPVVVERI
jgi:S-adenosylmethionine hydrolase